MYQADKEQLGLLMSLRSAGGPQARAVGHVGQARESWASLGSRSDKQRVSGEQACPAGHLEGASQC